MCAKRTARLRLVMCGVCRNCTKLQAGTPNRAWSGTLNKRASRQLGAKGNHPLAIKVWGYPPISISRLPVLGEFSIQEKGFSIQDIDDT